MLFVFKNQGKSKMHMLFASQKCFMKIFLFLEKLSASHFLTLNKKLMRYMDKKKTVCLF